VNWIEDLGKKVKKKNFGEEVSPQKMGAKGPILAKCLGGEPTEGPKEKKNKKRRGERTGCKCLPSGVHELEIPC